MYSDELMELLLAEEELPVRLIHSVMRSAVAQLEFTPVFLGSAYRNKGVQPLLGRRGPAAALAAGLPRRRPSPRTARGTRRRCSFCPIPDKPTVAMAFKMVEDPYGTLTFMRIYQGRFVKGGTYLQPADRAARSGSAASCGCTPTSAKTSTRPRPATSWPCWASIAPAATPMPRSANYCTLENMFVPEPVIRMAIAPASRDGADRLSKALHRFRREDPTLQVTTDEETGETIIAGMGELHLDIYVERIRREYNVDGRGRRRRR